ncbi:MAG TPA: FecR domain-containing protein [Elusimicrobiota bacterium]|nr:FecR domain-containing protein [Elusimicrobiota bacterium]
MTTLPYQRIIRPMAVLLAVVVWSVGLQAATVTFKRGNVQIQKGEAASWKAASRKQTLSEGDVIRTDANAEAIVELSAGHKFTIRPKTTFRFDILKDAQSQFTLIMGRLRAYAAKMKTGTKFEVRTPIAAASVRGTLFEMEVFEDQTSRLSVLEGVVSLRDLAGIGQEVQVMKDQSVTVEPGAAPRPPEIIPQELREGVVPTEGQRDAEFAFKSEIQREMGLSAFKDIFQTDAAQEMKVAQYQEGKTVIDAFGKRVRIEEYIVRPAANEWSFVALNTREDRFDFTRFDVYAKNALPEDIGSVNLFSGTGHNSMTNWVEKTHRLSSNGEDYYREWQVGGNPVNMTDANGNNPVQKVVFSDWYVELRSQSNAPVLVSHWQPDPAYSGGNYDATKTRDRNPADGSADFPSGYIDFEGADAGTTVGDFRKVDSDGFTNAQRLDFFDNATVQASYVVTEGYTRSKRVILDDVNYQTYIANGDTAGALNSKKISAFSTYTVPGGTDITIQVDQYYFNDAGDKLNLLQASSLGSNLQGVNYQTVFSSSLTGNRKIDVVISPSLLQKAGLLNN